MDGSPFLSATVAALDPLADAARAVETLFLDVGEKLSAGATDLATVTRRFESLTARLDQEDLRQALACLEQVAGGVAAISRASAGHLADLDGMVEKVSRLQARLLRLCKTITEVRLLSVNARIESAHVASGALDFSVFTQEIGRLSDLAEQSLQNLDGELDSLGQRIVAARDGQRRFQAAHRQSLTEIGEKIAASVATADGRRTGASETLAAIADEARSVGAHIAAVVLALQIVDITRQRLEHVAEALASPPDAPALAAALYRLQAAQLEHAADDLRQAAEAAQANLAAITGEAHRLEAQGRQTFGGGEDGQGSFLLDLAEQLRAANAMMSEYGQATRETESLVRAVAARGAGMVSHVEAVHSIEIDLRLMGLNATLKCGRLGSDGRALGIIAQTLRGYAGSTVADAGQVMEGLNNVIEAAVRLSGQTGGAEDGIGGLLSGIGGAEGSLTAAGTDLAEALTALATVLSGVTEALARAQTGLAGTTGLDGTLRAVAAHLRRLAADIAPPESDAELDPQLLEHLAGRYTMDRERQVHARHRTGSDDDAPAEQSQGGDVDQFLF